MAQAPSREGVAIDQLPVGLVQQLVRLDSSNPPGDERACVELIAALLRTVGVEPRILAGDPRRPNLVARVAGRGDAPPLLLYGHADVVPADAAEWTHKPFGGAIVDGELWGRGTLDMKGGLGMLITAFVRAAAGETPPPGDLILAVVSDEEAAGTHGAAYLVREHAEVFADVRHALGEFGGYTHYVGDRRLYPIQIAEKGRCLIRLTVGGDGGHASTPKRGGAVAKLAEALRAIERRPLPTHVTPPVNLMVRAMTDALPRPQAVALRAMLRPRLTGPVLRAAGSQAQELAALTRNTAVPTGVTAGEGANVSPTTAHVVLDGRLVPGHAPSELLAELERILPSGCELELLHSEPRADRQPDLRLIPLLADVLREDDPGGHPFPAVVPGTTDARHFNRLGIQTYGFLPMRLPPGLIPRLLHAPGERIPVSALVQGAAALDRVVGRYRG